MNGWNQLLVLEVTPVVRRRGAAGYVDGVFDGLVGNGLLHEELVLLSEERRTFPEKALGSSVGSRVGRLDCEHLLGASGLALAQPGVLALGRGVAGEQAGRVRGALPSQALRI